jgi:hypothetical protein
MNDRHLQCVAFQRQIIFVFLLVVFPLVNVKYDDTQCLKYKFRKNDWDSWIFFLFPNNVRSRLSV